MLFGKIGWLEALLIIGIILIIFGPGKLPGLSRALGQSIKNYKDALSGKDKNKDLDEAKEKE
ncbi:MAG TPA: twin-arginine translocase TatA/TatE family subunit [Firmicutes bacterium]|jgi:sec-independent protein translocase protein TatA|nr:twin-arginine translocase TatA/TatE family subunit [Bacillota bacterium]